MHDRDYPTPWEQIFQVITKTLPPDPLRVELDRMAAKWTPGACSEAGKLLFGNTSGEWTLEALAKVDAHLQTVAAMRQDSAMLERDEPKAASKPAAEDPLAAVRAAIQALREEMFECALDEVQNTGRHDPNYARADAAEEALLDEVRKLMGEVVLPDWMKATPAHDNGLLTSHNPDKRGVM